MPNKTLTQAETDDQIEAAVLCLLLEEHPTPLAPNAIRTRVNPGSGATFGPDDAVLRAARDLASRGLAHNVAGLTIASQAAVRAAALLGQ